MHFRVMPRILVKGGDLTPQKRYILRILQLHPKGRFNREKAEWIKCKERREEAEWQLK